MRPSLTDVVRAVLLEDMKTRGLRLDVKTDSYGRSGPLGDPSDLDEEGWRKRVVDFARSLKDTPYTWGGESVAEGFDCSGLVWYVLKTSGLAPNLPREASDRQMALGTSIGQADLKLGDMVGFKKKDGTPSHIGFYLGEGDRYISAAGGDQNTKMGKPPMPRSGQTPRVMEMGFEGDPRIKYFSSLSDLISKRIEADGGDTSGGTASSGPKEFHYNANPRDSDALKGFIAAFAPEYQRVFGKPLYVGSTYRGPAEQARAMEHRIAGGDYDKLYGRVLGGELNRVRELIKAKKYDDAGKIIAKKMSGSHLSGSAFDVPFTQNALMASQYNKFAELVARVAKEKGFKAAANGETDGHFHVDVRS
jgi:hypothetical protein